MSAIITAIMQQKAGQPSVQQERTGKDLTQAHLAAHGGLRGHSVDAETYPWRIVGHPGNAWSVQGADGVTIDRIVMPEWVQPDVDELALSEATELAKRLKQDFPGGVVDSPCTIKGHTVDAVWVDEFPF